MSFESYGDYQLLKKLATGGMAQIYLARQQGMEGFEKFLVVKRILPHLAENDDFIKMFLDEARIAARLNHPNIVQIFNLGAQDDSYFIAMEFIHGEDVRRVWKRADLKAKPIPVPLVARIIMDACGGLDYAHKKVDSQGKPLNIVHRDISPQNILVTFEGGVKVVDFGIAKAADQATVTKSGVLKGKYSYMSPEQASGQKIDRRSDIFALGVVLYELTTGTRLFKRANDIQTLNAVTECEVLPPSEVNPALPKDFDPIVMKALAKRPEDRYQEAILFQAALENWVLQNKFPSSSVQLAGFMQDIYAERLMQEAEEGRILIEGLDASRNEASKNGGEERATPVSKASRLPQTTSLRAVDARLDKEEATIAQRPSNRSGSLGGAVSGAVSRSSRVDRAPPAPVPRRADHDDDRGGATVTSTQTKSGTGRPLLWVGSFFAIVGLAVSAWVVISSNQLAEVVIASEPSNATVKFDNKVLANCVTPCTLPEVPAGAYPLVLSRAGYQDLKTRVDIPAKGRVRLPAYALVPESKDDPVAVAGPDAGAVASVKFVVRSSPDGAQVLVDGKARGVTPATLDLPPGTVIGLGLKLSGYRDFNDSFQVSGDGERTIGLEKRETNVVQQPPPPPPKREFGMVRFIVKPWASVQCGAFKLGDTPFADKQLPAGAYDCTFSNPEFPDKKQAVVVKPNETVRVSVNF